MVFNFLFATDLHGSTYKMSNLVKKAIEEDLDMIILGGDLFMSGRSSTIGSQIKLLEEEVQPIFEEFPGEVLTIFGNNDWYKVSRSLEDHAPKLKSIEGREHNAGEGLSIMGFSYVPASPFMIKDWELLERTAGPLRGARMQGYCSRQGDIKECSVDREFTIMDRLEGLGSVEGKILVSHTPPRGTNCSMGHGGVDLGSSDLLEFMVRNRPSCVLCGHIHESPERSGYVMDRIGNCIVGNPGSFSRRMTGIKCRWDGELHMEPVETHIVK